MSESFTTKQVAEHASVENGLYIIIDGSVYALDKFVDEHPGGAKILKRVGGKDASKQFWKVSLHAPYLQRCLVYRCTGETEGKEKNGQVVEWWDKEDRTYES